MNQDELRRQMDLLAEDARQRSVGRRIAGITHTNTIITVYKDGGEPEKGTETPWDGQTSRCHDGKNAPVDDNRNEAACRRSSSRGFSRRRIRPPKPLGSINKSEPRKYPPNADGKWTNPMHVANPKSTRGNRSIVASCEPIKTVSVPYPVPLASWSDADEEPAIDADADADATTNEEGFYPFSLI